MFIWILINYYLLWLLWLLQQVRRTKLHCALSISIHQRSKRRQPQKADVYFPQSSSIASCLECDLEGRRETNHDLPSVDLSIYLITSRVEDLLCSSSWSQNDNKQHAVAGEAITILFDLTNKMGNIFDIFQCFCL